MDKQEVVDRMLANMEELKEELDYLRWFHANCPINPVILFALQDAYTEMGNVVPGRWWAVNGDSNAQT